MMSEGAAKKSAIFSLPLHSSWKTEFFLFACKHIIERRSCQSHHQRRNLLRTTRGPRQGVECPKTDQCKEHIYNLVKDLTGLWCLLPFRTGNSLSLFRTGDSSGLARDFHMRRLPLLNNAL